ncbi:MAG: hypothetical protein ABSB97_03030 [Thermoplasmata archaeon]|jgi:hypothetical protein
MAGRPSSTPGTASSLRLEVLKELQTLLDDREVRDRLDRGPLAETKGREHWVLHLLLRAQESSQAHLDTLIGSAYSNLLARLQSVEDRLQKIETVEQSLGENTKQRFDGLETTLSGQVTKELTAGMEATATRITAGISDNLDLKWKPVGGSIEAFAQASHQLSKDLSDTYRVATQNRLLLNENARRIIDLGRDIVALEESLKLALTKVLEDGLQPLEDRIAALESRLAPSVDTNGAHATADPPDGG